MLKKISHLVHFTVLCYFISLSTVSGKSWVVLDFILVLERCSEKCVVEKKSLNIFLGTIYNYEQINCQSFTHFYVCTNSPQLKVFTHPPVMIWYAFRRPLRPPPPKYTSVIQCIDLFHAPFRSKFCVFICCYCCSVVTEVR